MGERCYKDLLDIPDYKAGKIEIVDIFRPAKEVDRIVEDAMILRRKFGKPEVIWMQLGIINQEAAEKARKAGFEVVMDHCMKKEHERLCK